MPLAIEGGPSMLRIVSAKKQRGALPTKENLIIAPAEHPVIFFGAFLTKPL